MFANATPEYIPIGTNKGGSIGKATISMRTICPTSFRVTYHQRVETEKGGIGNEVRYRAVLRELDQPDQDGNTFAGTGDYTVLVNLKPANCSYEKMEGVEKIEGGGSLKAGASINPSWTGSGAEVMAVSLTPLDGPKQRLFTGSFTALEKMHREESEKDGEKAPLLAPDAVGWVELRGRSGDSTHVFSMGTSPCEGLITGTNVTRAMRLR